MDFDHSKEQDLQELQERVIRITEAVYRTTDVFSDVEPLKWALRSSAVEVVNMVTSGSRHDHSRAVNLVKAMMLKLRLAASGAFVARANFDVLERAYRDLEARLGELSRDTISLPTPPPLSIEKLLDIPIKDNKTDIMSDKMSETDSELITNNHAVSFSKEASNHPLAAPAHSSVIQKRVYAPRASGGGSDRKNALVELLRGRGPSSVGDLIQVIGMSVSEKTIQRDLNALADAGVLGREGEKRWRRYFIKA
jgi:hypothetical protein